MMFFDDPAPVDPRALSFFRAASRGDTGYVDLLLAEGTVDYTTLVNGFNALHSAAKKGHAGVVRSLITHDRSLQTSQTENDLKTAGMIACYEGRFEIVRILVDDVSSGAYSVKDAKGNNILHYAAWGGHLDITKYLIETIRMDINIENNDGMTCMQMAAAGNHDLVVEYLCFLMDPTTELQQKSSCGFNAIHRAALYGSLETLRVLVTKLGSCDIDAGAKNGSTALHLACQHGRLPAALYLLDECGANINATNEWNLTPLHFACTGGHSDVVEALLARKADYFILNAGRATALHMAAANGNREICKRLSELPDIDLFAKDEQNQTPIDAALAANRKELASQIARWSFVKSQTEVLIHRISIDTKAQLLSFVNCAN